MVVTAQEIIKQMMYAEHSNRAGKKKYQICGLRSCVFVGSWEFGGLFCSFFFGS